VPVLQIGCIDDLKINKKSSQAKYQKSFLASFDPHPMGIESTQKSELKRIAK
jgi:hypothetical protein